MFIIFSKNNCIYCTKTKETLSKQQIQFNNFEIESQQEILELKKKTNQSTFPFIYHKNNFIGGYTDLLKYIYSPEFSMIV